MSTLKVNNIAGVSGGTSPPITLSGDTATLSGTGVTFPAGHILQVVTTVDNTEIGVTTNQTPYNYSQLNTAITLKKASSKILVQFNFGALHFQAAGNLGYAKIMFKIGSGSYSDLTPIGANTVNGSSKHHMAVNLTDQTYQVDAGPSMIGVHTTSSAIGTVLTYAPYFWGEGSSSQVFINRSYRNTDPSDFSTISSCTLMEIAT